MNKSNLIIRTEQNGTYVFNFFTGLIYFVVKEFEKEVLDWIDNPDNTQIDLAFRETIGVGWNIPLDQSNLNRSQVLPSIDLWNNEFPDFPLTVNWFLTGLCPLDCVYCYAEDLMRKNVTNPTLNEILKIADNIIEINPLVVVITGGDPLVSPHLKVAINSLYNKTGILLDTSGFNMTDDIAEFCKNKNVGIRISLDAIKPEINNIQRPLLNKKHQRKRASLDNELKAIDTCLKFDIPLTIQTVLTELNYNHLMELRNFLIEKGIKIWRIQMLQEPSDKIKKLDYGSLFSRNSDQDFHDSTEIIERIKKINNEKCNDALSIKFTENNYTNRNSVILVSPEGNFYSELINSKGKFLIDSESPSRPSKKALLKFINHSGHLVRYLNF